MKPFLLFFYLLTLIYSNALSQKILYGVNLDKTHPEVKGQKIIKLKDNSIFYSVIIRVGNQYLFSTVKKGFGPFKNSSKYYGQGLKDIKKVFGNPINIYTDTTLTSKTTDLYLWKIKRDKGYFFIYYDISRLGLTLNIDRIVDEETINNRIGEEIFEHQVVLNREYYVKASEINMKNVPERLSYHIR